MAERQTHPTQNRTTARSWEFESPSRDHSGSSINKAIASPYDALWWGIVTMTTVGYGDVFPITGEGRLFAAALMILGIGLFSAITATVTSFMLEGSADVPAQIAKLANLNATGALSDEEFGTAKARLLARL